MRIFIFVLCFICSGQLLFGNQISFGEDLAGWKKRGKGSAVLDKKVKLSRTSSLKLHNGGAVFRTLQLDPDSVYELSFYVRGEKLSGTGNDGARIMLNGGKRWGRITSQGNNAAEKGSFDWRRGKGLIDTTFFGTRVTVYFRAADEGTVWYDDVQLVKKSVKKNNDSFRKAYGGSIRRVLLVPGGIFGFFKPGEKVTFRILLDSQEKDISYEAVVRDETGRIVQTLSRRKAEKSFVLDGQPSGYYVVTADFYVKNKKAYTIQSGFVSAPEIHRRDPFFQMGYGLLPEMPEGIRRIGVGTISLKIRWYSPTTVGAPERMWKWSYSTGIKPYLEAGGFEYSANVNTSLRNDVRSPQELKEGWPLLSDKLLNHYKKSIDLALDAFKGRVKHWTFQQEIPSNASMKKYVGTWTESMANFVVLCRMGSRQVRARIPDAKILAGGCNVQSTLKDIERITMTDLVNEFHGYVIDAYTGNWNMTLGSVTLPENALMNFYKEAVALSEKLGKGSVIKNEELGYCISYGAPFDRGMAVEQAQLTARQLLITKASAVSGFELHQPSTPVEENISDQAGCMTTVWKPAVFKGRRYHLPLPGGAMYVTAASQLAFAGSPRYFHRDSLFCCIFTRPDKSTLLVLWNTEGEKELNIDLPAAARQVSMYGREKKLSAGVQKIRCSQSPLYLNMDYPAGKLEKLMKKTLEENIPEFKGRGFAVGSKKARIFIHNLTGKSRSGTLPGGEKVKLRPGKIEAFTVELASPVCRFTADNGRKYDFAVEQDFYPVPRLRSKVDLERPGAWLKGLPEGKLSYPDDIYPRTALQPELSYFKTAFNPKGHDFSAKYWVAYDDENFYIAVLADDPTHFQRYSGMDIWRDDSLQVVFASDDLVTQSLKSVSGRKMNSTLNFGIALTPRGVVTAKYRGRDAGLKKIPASVTRKDGKTFYQAVFPFKMLGGRPARFGFVIFDNNSIAQKSSPYWLQFSPGIAGREDSTRLRLIGYGD